jgi:hypothetical protein
MKGTKVPDLDFWQSEDLRSIKILANNKLYLLQENHKKWSITNQADLPQLPAQDTCFLTPSLLLNARRTLIECPNLKEYAVHSLPLWHPKLLQTFFCKGYQSQVV